jgi:hypothetical protein
VCINEESVEHDWRVGLAVPDQLQSHDHAAETVLRSKLSILLLEGLLEDRLVQDVHVPRCCRCLDGSGLLVFERGVPVGENSTTKRPHVAVGLRPELVGK